MLPRSLLAAVAVLGILLTLTVVAAPFTIDENNYLVTVLGLRQGRLSVPSTDGLPESRALFFFDPAASERIDISTPAVSVAPPLYAPLALPFSFLGWRGLVALNTIAFLATILIVFVHTRRFASDATTPWLAAVTVALASYFVEYAQGLWPHMLTVALCAGAVLLAGRALESGGALLAGGAGFLIALAAGVRYQNAFVLGCLGLALFLLGGGHRLRVSIAYAAGAAIPLAVSSALNAARLGSWNPISKGPGYLVNPIELTTADGSWLGNFATMAWARLVDYAARPPMTGSIHGSFLSPQPESGAYVLVTAVKKAWLQSSPWMIVPLLVLALAWLPRGRFARILDGAPQRQLRMLSLVVLLTVAMFSAAGIYRTSGLNFNQRYFCELVPLVAVAFAWSVEGVARRRTPLLLGALTGTAMAYASLQPHHLAPLRHYLLMYVPLAIAAFLLASWALALVMSSRRAMPVEIGASEASSRSGPGTLGARSSSATPGAVLALLVGTALGWAMTVHLGDDLVASRILRRSHESYLRQLRPHLSDRSAVFASGRVKDALGPLQIELDVVIVVPGLDRAETTKKLLDALLAQGRRVFFLPKVMPDEMLREIFADRPVVPIGRPIVMVEVRDGASGPGAER